MSVYTHVGRNKIGTWVVMGGFILVMSFLFYGIGWFIDSSAMFFIVGFFVALASSIGSYYFADKIVLRMSNAQPASKEDYFDLYTITENLAIATGLPMPRLYVIHDPAPNAFATGRNPDNAVICVTTGLLQKLDRAELEGVVAHELSHVKNYDILIATIVGVLVGTIAFVTEWFLHSLWWGGSSDRTPRSPLMLILFVVVVLVSPLVASIIQLAISRKREYLADASAVLITRYPEGLARALEKISADQNRLHSAHMHTAHFYISNPLSRDKRVHWLTRLFSTHPPIEERVAILRSM